ncbi:MAG: hypothetical protein H0V09_11185, partial [Gemmatimonadetes bacterium]|nr:hypothetical protein [Gemmatimonadota bacterium]
MEILSAHVAQTRPRLGDVAGNLREIQRMAGEARAAGAQIVLFPELALTGYALQDAVSAVALRADGPELAGIAERSADVALVIGFVEEGGDGAFYNSVLVAMNGRVTAIHRKRHLPTYGLFDEGRFFKPGTDVCVVELAGWRLGILICEEAWYPRTVDELIAGGAEALLIPANGPGRGAGGGARWQSQD